MRRAIVLAGSVRTMTAPNPWVGAVVVPKGTTDRFEGATAPPGGAHAEVAALEAAGEKARGGTLYTTLEPCSHQGRTPPCVDAVLKSGIERVVVGILDPDPQVAGRGARLLEDGGVEVEIGVLAGEVEDLLAPYLKHRRTGRPWVVLKLAATLDGRIAAPDGSSKWITGEQARSDAHRLRAESGAVLVGAGTVRIDDPALTVRLALPSVDAELPAANALGGDEQEDQQAAQPLRVVLGEAPSGARVHPALEMSGDLGEILDELGKRGVLQLLVEGGARVAHSFHASRLVDRYVIYLAPSLFGGNDALPMFSGPGEATVEELWRGDLVSVAQLGSDVRIELAPVSSPDGGGTVGEAA